MNSVEKDIENNYFSGGSRGSGVVNNARAEYQEEDKENANTYNLRPSSQEVNNRHVKKASDLMFRDNVKENINNINMNYNLTPNSLMGKNGSFKTLKTTNTQVNNNKASTPNKISSVISPNNQHIYPNSPPVVSKTQKQQQIFNSQNIIKANGSPPIKIQHTNTNSIQSNKMQSIGSAHHMQSTNIENNNNDNSMEIRMKESFVTNVSRRYQDFNEEESIDQEFNNIANPISR